MRHMSQALRLINEGLSGNDAVSDQTIAAVVLMVLYERQQGQFRRGLIHVKGLRQMTELRGGMSQLARTKPALIQMIFR